MNTIEHFKLYLLGNSKNSAITVKNYVSDVNKFIKWFERKYSREFLPADFSQSTLSDFISESKPLITDKDTTNGLTNQSKLQNAPSTRSMERYLSSLRRFASYLTEVKLIDSNPFTKYSILDTGYSPKDPWYLKSFKDFLYVGGVSSVTSKNYMVDLKAFSSWLEYKGFHAQNASTPPTAGSNYLASVTPGVVETYKEVLTGELGLLESTVARKMSSIRKYLSFAAKNGLISEEVGSWGLGVSKKIPIEPVLDIQEALQETTASIPLSDETLNLTDIAAETTNSQELTANPQFSPFPPARLLQRIAEPYFLFEDKAAQSLSSFFKIKKISLRRPNFKQPMWYRRYHNISFVHYLHVAILIIYASLIGGIVYSNLFSLASQNKTLAANVSPPNVLSFQGRLADNNNNPITTASNVRFMIYSNSTSSGSAYLLWQELGKVTPDSNGIFSVLLGNGSTCTNSPNGVATTACAFPSTLFSGNTNLYLGITVENTAELTPRQQLANARYAANSQTLQGYVPITASGAPQSNVILALDSSGNLIMSGGSEHKFAATGGQFTLTGDVLHLKTIEGSNSNIIIEPDDLAFVDIRAPIINESIKGRIAPGGVEFNDKVAILATESAVAAFIINNDTSGGDIFAASSSGATKFVIQNNGDLSIQAGASIDTLSNGTISIGGVNASTISLGRIGQAITLPGFTGQNGILYGEYGTGGLTQATTAQMGLCLLSGAQNPVWGSCNSSSTSPFKESGGTIFANNSTVDFLVGGQSTASAAFSVTNANSGTPTASISGNLIVMPNLSRGSGGFVGIGVSNPSHYLQLGVDDAAKASPAWTVISDVRTKTNIGTFSDGLNVINQINPVNFTYNGLGGTLAGTTSIGVIAQDIQRVAPYMVGEFDVKLHPNDTKTTKVLDFNASALFFITINAIKELNTKIDALAHNFTTETLQAGTITANNISIATDSFSIAGKSLEEYVASTVKTILNTEYSILNTDQIVSPLASIDELHTNLISPVGEAKEIKIKANVTIDGSATISGLLAAQSASISGQLTANSLQTTDDATIGGQLTAETIDSSRLTVNQDATIGGTLYATNIKADSIEDLDSRIISNYHKAVASVTSPLLASLTNTGYSIPDTRYLDIASISSDFATFRQGLISLGPASFTQASFSDSIAIGTTMTISSNAINTIATDLAFQPLKQGAVDFLAGALRIETDGTLKVNGDAFFAKDVTISGKLKTGTIEGNQDGLTISGPTLDIQGAASISGALTINKLNLFAAQPAYAISETEVVSTGSAGMDSIKPYRSELTIYNSNVTDKSLIYITPVGSTYNFNPTLLRQSPGVSFTVGIPQLIPAELKFNWIIIN